MSSRHTARPRVPGASTLVGAACVVVGAVLAVTLDMAFILLLAAGAFGPGALRELGLLHDQDELQRESARTAGYRAYLLGGLVAAALVAADRRGTASLDTEVAGAVGLVLMVLLAVWLMSALYGFWDARRAAVLTLVAFGAVWLTFVLLSHLAEPMALLMESLVVAPFFVLAWVAGRWPRVAGVLLLAAAALAFVGFDLARAFTDRPGQRFVIVLLFVPLVASGLALLRPAR